MTTDEIQLGGPNPFPAETTGDCPAVSDSLTWPWLCTRDAGHDLPHVAVAGLGDNPRDEIVAATWPPLHELGEEAKP